MGEESESDGGLHGVIDIDVSGLTIDQRAALESSLRFDGIRHEITHDVLRCPAVWQRRVEMHLDDATTRTFEPGYARQPYRPYATVGRAMAGVPYPRPWRRLVAALVDSVIVGLPTGLLNRADLWVVGLAVSPVYIVGLTALSGQNVGKLALRIRVIDEVTGVTPSLWRSLVRWFVAFGVAIVLGSIPGPDALRITLAWLVFVVGLVVVVPILYDTRRRGLHDRIAGTVVIDASASGEDLSGDEDAGFDVEEVAESN